MEATSRGCGERPGPSTHFQADLRAASRLLRIRIGADHFHHPGGWKAIQSRPHPQLAESQRRYHEWLDAWALLDAEQPRRVCAIFAVKTFMLLTIYSVILLLLLVSRSKLVPDFALTIHFLHFVTTSLYTRSLPTNLLWWALQICSSALMISLGIWACQWRELRPMSFGGAVAKAKATPALPFEVGDSIEDNEDGLFNRVLGRMRRVTDTSRGDYEMVGLHSGEDGS